MNGSTLALSFAVVMVCLGPALDKHDAERPTTAAAEAQTQAQQEFRRDLAAAELCRKEHGASLVRWTVDGELVCIPLDKVAAL
jgi:hypothetical protein